MSSSAGSDSVTTLAAALARAAETGNATVLEAAVEAFFSALGEGNAAAARAVPRALRRSPLPADVSRSWSCYFRAILASDGRRWDTAERLALAALRGAAGPGLRGRACNELGILYDHLGRWSEAVAFYRLGLAAFESLGDMLYVARLSTNLGIALVRGSEAGAWPPPSLEEAIALFRRALDILGALQQPEPEALVWNELGAAFKAQGRWEDARRCYQRFREYSVAAGDRLREGQSLNNLAEVYHAEGRLEEAQAALVRAQQQVAGDIWEEADIQRNLAQVLFDRGDLPAATLAADRALNDIESLRARLQTATTRSDYAATQERTYAFRARLARLAGHADAAFALAERAKARTFAELLAGERLRAHADVPPRWRREEAALRVRMERLTAGGRPLSGGDRDEAVAIEARWQELRRRIALQDADYGPLGEATPLTPEAVLDRLPAGCALLEYYADDNELVACLVQERQVDVIPLGISLPALAAASFDHRGRPRGLVAENGRLGRPWVLERLSRALLQPVLGHLHAADLLCVVPHSALHHLPFAALPAHADGPSLAQHVGAVVQAPSATVWLGYCQALPVSSTGSACVLGYNGRSLHHAEAEAQAVAGCLGATATTGPAATRASLRAQAAAARHIHLACHGVFRPDQPLRSGLRLADGFLDVGEIVRTLHLQAELVVLSGCETGIGSIQGGDEIVGLARAWLYAGTAAVLVSLWAVDDLPTRLLMLEFYSRLAASGPARALAEAASALTSCTAEAIEERLLASGLAADRSRQELLRLCQLWPAPPPHPLDHPYFHAPFVLQGGRPGPPREP